MTQIFKPGVKLSSKVCKTQIMVLRIPAIELEIFCGGLPMEVGDPDVLGEIQGENNGGKKNSNDEVLSKSMLKEKRKKAKETLIAKSMKPSKKAKKMKGIKGKRGKKKIYFEKKKNDQMDPNIAGEGPAVGMIEMSEMKSDTENPMRKKTSSFRRLETSVGGREYFENLGKPGQTTWKVPEGGEIVLSD